MLIKECVICGNKIENPRLNKKYCSDTCKSRAHTLKKKEQSEENHKVETEFKLPEVLYTFDYEEYSKARRKLHEINFQIYCFLRKNLSGTPDINFIVEYIEEFNISEILTDQSSSVIKKEFDKFLHIYHSGQVEIINTNIIQQDESSTN